MTKSEDKAKRRRQAQIDGYKQKHSAASALTKKKLLKKKKAIEQEMKATKTRKKQEEPKVTKTGLKKKAGERKKKSSRIDQLVTTKKEMAAMKSNEAAEKKMPDGDKKKRSKRVQKSHDSSKTAQTKTSSDKSIVFNTPNTEGREVSSSVVTPPNLPKPTRRQLNLDYDKTPVKKQRTTQAKVSAGSKTKSTLVPLQAHQIVWTTNAGLEKAMFSNFPSMKKKIVQRMSYQQKLTDLVLMYTPKKLCMAYFGICKETGVDITKVDMEAEFLTGMKARKIVIDTCMSNRKAIDVDAANINEKEQNR